MSLPFFYTKQFHDGLTELMLDEETSRHIVQVLRMKIGQPIKLTDGEGNIIEASITDDHKKHCVVMINSVNYEAAPKRKITLGVSLIKNTSRFEWMLEKVTEIGIQTIIPLICERTENEKFRMDRLQGILISAMIQSQQSWLPELLQPADIKSIIKSSDHIQKFIAHCEDEKKSELSDLVNTSISSHIILIGPEGDFSPNEIQLALSNHFTPVALGKHRLRTETAGVVAATLLAMS